MASFLQVTAVVIRTTIEMTCSRCRFIEFLRTTEFVGFYFLTLGHYASSHCSRPRISCRCRIAITKKNFSQFKLNNGASMADGMLP